MSSVKFSNSATLVNCVVVSTISKVSDFILNIEGSRVHFGNSEKGVSTYFIFIDNFSA